MKNNKKVLKSKVSLKLYRTLNEHENDLTFEHITLMDQIICTRRQLRFQVFKKCNLKIGMNTTANKFSHLNNLIGLDMLNLGFVHFKKLAKFQFLKNGST